MRMCKERRTNASAAGMAQSNQRYEIVQLSKGDRVSLALPRVGLNEGMQFKAPVKSHKTAISLCDSQATTDGYFVRYTAWTDVESAFDYYDKQYADDPTALVRDGQRVGDQWRRTSNEARGKMPFKVSGAFYHAPFSWSVEAASEAALERGLSQLDIAKSTAGRSIVNWGSGHASNTVSLPNPPRPPATSLSDGQSPGLDRGCVGPSSSNIEMDDD